MDMTSDLSLQESCMAALRHMGVEVRALVGKTNELEVENEKLIVKLNAEHIIRQNVEAENAKLREFAKNAYRHICTQEGYLRGSGYDSFDYFDTVVRELGIGVEE